MHSSTKQKHLVGLPAGSPTHAEGQQPVGVLVQSARDRRTLEWLIAEVGEAAVAAACVQLAGNRRPYVSNLAKILGVSPPLDLSLTPQGEAKERIASLKRILRKGK